jgi:hypothetical protein
MKLTTKTSTTTSAQAALISLFHDHELDRQMAVVVTRLPVHVELRDPPCETQTRMKSLPSPLGPVGLCPRVTFGPCSPGTLRTSFTLRALNTLGANFTLRPLWAYRPVAP